MSRPVKLRRWPECAQGLRSSSALIGGGDLWLCDDYGVPHHLMSQTLTEGGTVAASPTRPIPFQPRQ